jgi:uncharacterized protein (DUF2345 family)
MLIIRQDQMNQLTARTPGGNAVEPCPLAKTTWIEIVLVGEDDQPVAGERYRITLPDGHVIEGRLDAKGEARVEDLDPGNCVVTFPRLDADAWNAA